MSQPRVRTVSVEENCAYYRYKRHDISISRDDQDDDWYIIVKDDSGCACYHGWWPDSAGKSKREAILEAIRGACINEQPGRIHTGGAG